jgi:hypothetical protein
MSIGEWAFGHGYGLHLINIRSGVASIGSVALGWCFKLERIVILYSVTFMGRAVF